MVALHSVFLVLHLLLEGGLHHLGLSLPCLQCLKPRAEMPFTRAEMPFHPLVVSVLLRRGFWPSLLLAGDKQLNYNYVLCTSKL